jgi:nuclear cap-binding protein subunit 1
MRRAIALEIRLAYYDRIMKTLPESYQDPAAGAVPAQAPGPNFEYEDSGTPPHTSWMERRG